MGIDFLKVLFTFHVLEARDASNIRVTTFYQCQAMTRYFYKRYRVYTNVLLVN